MFTATSLSIFNMQRSSRLGDFIWRFQSDWIRIRVALLIYFILTRITRSGYGQNLGYDNLDQMLSCDVYGSRRISKFWQSCYEAWRWELASFFESELHHAKPWKRSSPRAKKYSWWISLDQCIH